MGTSERSRRLEEVYSARNNRELAGGYDAWAQEYDQDMSSLGYTIPAVAAGFVGRYVPPEGTVLDAGAGTGLFGETLKVLDYADLVGIDLSEGMLEKAREKNVYRDLRQMALGERLDFADDSFAAVVSVGVFTEGHAPPESFDELVRITRPGGWMVFSVRDDLYTDGGFKEKQDALEREGEWRQIKTSDAFRPFPIGESSLLNRVFVC